MGLKSVEIVTHEELIFHNAHNLGAAAGTCRHVMSRESYIISGALKHTSPLNPLEDPNPIEHPRVTRWKNNPVWISTGGGVTSPYFRSSTRLCAITALNGNRLTDCCTLP